MLRSRALTGRSQQLLIVAAALALTVIPLLAQSGVHGLHQWIGVISTVVGAVALAWWRRYPIPVLVVGPLLLMVTAVTGPEPSNFLLPILVGYAALAAEHFSGQAAWAAGFGCAAYIAALYAISSDAGSPGLIILIAPGFFAGTALRLRRETAEQLAESGRELEAERELFADVSVRNERARIASELHDIVGHALSVMVVQAAAGQRLASHSPGAAVESLDVIAESARQGRADLQRLIDLLAGTDEADMNISLIDEVVGHAARSGLRVTFRHERAGNQPPREAAHAAFRIVQESLTNALRHAPGAEVRVSVCSDAHQVMSVRVENDAAPHPAAEFPGTGRGLIGLRERVLDLGGTFSAGPVRSGGWAVEARLPTVL